MLGVNVIVNLAHEGVPVRAICRCLSVPSDQVRSVLQGAFATGSLTEIPREDWPANVAKNQRLPGLNLTYYVDDDVLLLNLVRLFRVTPQQALLLLVLLKRREVTRTQMHQAIENRRSGEKEETDKKIVDVVICKLRKRLRAFDLIIDTVWAWGYAMPTEDRRRAVQLLNEFMESPEDVIKSL